MIYTYNGMLLNLKKEGDPAIYRNMDERGGHHTSDVSQLQKDSATQLHLYEVSRIVKLKEAESRGVVSRSRGGGGNRSCCF